MESNYSIIYLKNRILNFYWQKRNRVPIFAGIKKFPEIMFTFEQYLGFIAFLTILTIGFWLMFFLVGILPYWIGGNIMENLKERKEKKRLEKESKA